MPVQLLTLEERPVQQIGEFVGTIKSRRSMTVQPQVEGFLTRLHVTSGMRVSQGMPLFEIDPTTQQAAIATLEAQRAARTVDVRFARQQAERAKRLIDAGATSTQEFEQAEAQLESADALLKVVEDQIRQQRTELAYYTVVAQTAGVVGDVPVRTGDRVTRATALTTIEDNQELEAYVNVPVQQAPLLKMGQAVRLVTDAGETLYETRVSFIAATVDDATQTVLVKAPIPRGSALRAAQFVRAQVVWSAAPGLTLPVVAVQRVGNQSFAFVAEAAEGGGLVARQKPVTLGPVLGDAYVVLGGLRAGDRLVLGGTQKIGDGAPVQELPAGRGGV
jgi:RND family efflux transporter MFP subunit